MVGSPDYIPVIPKGVIGLCIDYNDGIAWGALGDALPIVKIAIIVGTGVMMLVLFVFWIKTDYRRKFLRVALIFVIAGGVGNLIDRLYYRIWDASSMLGVRDMVQIDFGAIFREFLNINISEQFLNFGICNFADFFISAGAVMLVLSLLFLDTDAIFPATKKYKALAKESEEKAEAKKQEKNNG
jgi:lipoprotein signal peptidase